MANVFPGIFPGFRTLDLLLKLDTCCSITAIFPFLQSKTFLPYDEILELCQEACKKGKAEAFSENRSQKMQVSEAKLP